NASCVYAWHHLSSEIDNGSHCRQSPGMTHRKNQNKTRARTLPRATRRARKQIQRDTELNSDYLEMEFKRKTWRPPFRRRHRMRMSNCIIRPQQRPCEAAANARQSGPFPSWSDMRGHPKRPRRVRVFTNIYGPQEYAAPISARMAQTDASSGIVGYGKRHGRYCDSNISITNGRFPPFHFPFTKITKYS
ncbi:hypothetical protein, partial [Ralstonia solanacearum]|uniref:hypothetical protein n=1 Tax=Ralstonia solanacearum TaxID=305 RepID=UPI001E48AF4F